MADEKTSDESGHRSVELEPFILPIFITLLFALASLAYVEIAPKAACDNDVIASAALFLGLLAYLSSRAVAHSDRRLSNEPATSNSRAISSWTFAAVGFTPGLLLALNAWHKCLGSKSITNYYEAGVIGLLVLFSLGVVSTLAVPAKSPGANTIAPYAVLPAMLVSLLLSLGSPSFFGFFSGLLTANILDSVLDVRLLILGVVFLLIIVDAFLLSRGWNAIRAKVQGIADRTFRLRDINLNTQNPFLVFGLAILNIAIGFARFTFQILATVGFAAFDFALSFGTAVTKFILNAGTLYGLLLSGIMLASTWMMAQALSLMPAIRSALSTSSANLEWFFLYFALFYLVICVSHAFLARAKSGRIAVSIDFSAKIAGLAVIGAWIASIMTHVAASIMPFGLHSFFQAPAFSGLGSLGLFFWAVSTVAVIGSIYAIFWITNPNNSSGAEPAE
ncbi:hypothetical protein [Rhizobium sp.]|jgi:hypothetical protein|uniref:hypothetical protein n=1 Tax=Rhizobium sp. TaxID=391 RepID=UPI000E9007C4|nr:hypothetical protein [Rhizobium sp.]